MSAPPRVARPSMKESKRGLTENPRGRLGPDEWVEAAYSAFAAGGIEAVNVDALAWSLGVTRGSFYWHFENRDALLVQIVVRWLTLETTRIVQEIEATGGSAAERLRLVMQSAETDDGKFELTIRNWARKSEYAASIVQAADAQRIAYLKQLLVEHGVDEMQAQRRARLIYLAQLGHHLDISNVGLTQMAEDLEKLYQLVLT